MQGLPVLCSAGECQDVDLAKHVPASSMLMTCTAAECAWPLQKHADNEGDQHPHKDTDLESGDMDDSKPTLQLPPFSGVRGAHVKPDDVQLCFQRCATCMSWCIWPAVPIIACRAAALSLPTLLLCKQPILDALRVQVHIRMLAPSRSCWPRKCPRVPTIFVPTMSACTTRWIRLRGATCHSRYIPCWNDRFLSNIRRIHLMKPRGAQPVSDDLVTCGLILPAGWHDRCPAAHCRTRNPHVSATQ